MKTFTYIITEEGREDHVWSAYNALSSEILRDLQEVDEPQSVWEMHLKTNKLTDVSERYADEWLFHIVEKEAGNELLDIELPEFVRMNSNRINEVLDEMAADQRHFAKYGY